MTDSVRILKGSVAYQSSKPSLDQLEEKLSSDMVTQRGLLIIGGAGQGKTNVILKICSDILQKAGKNDLVIFFDVKGDYYSTFYADGDMFLSPTDDAFIWNIFEDFKHLPLGHELEYRIRETIEYLFVGMESEKEPFWTNGAKLIMYCLISYMLMKAEIDEDTSILCHYDLSRLIEGEMRDSPIDCYENYRNILMSNIKFRSAGMLIPPADVGTAMGYGIITEILAMKNRIFVGSFGEKKRRGNQEYISPGFVRRYSEAPSVLFLRYNQRYQDVCAPVYRCFVDMLIASQLETVRRDGGRLILVLDELASLPELRRLGQALELGRQFGIRVIAGLQTVEQMKQNYRRNLHEANVILGGFQNTIAFRSDSETVKFLRDRFGNALAQRIYTKPGGGMGLTEPIIIPAAELYDFMSLGIGESVVQLEGEAPFIIQFPLYTAED